MLGLYKVFKGFPPTIGPFYYFLIFPRVYQFLFFRLTNFACDLVSNMFIMFENGNIICFSIFIIQTFSLTH